MKPAINDASARRDSGGPSPVPSRDGGWENRPRSPDVIKVERQIAELVDRSTHDLRVAWRELHRTGPPQGLSRDLLIRALAHRLQEQTHGGTSRAQRRRLQTLAREFDKGSGSSDPGIVLRTGTALVRQWRGHTHTVRVDKNGFEALRSAPRPADDAVSEQRHTAERIGSLCDLHPQILRGGLERFPATIFPGTLLSDRRRSASWSREPRRSGRAGRAVQMTSISARYSSTRSSMSHLNHCQT
jgi:Protein of unknown function (DUF2924)